MIFPATYTEALVCLALMMLCWGSWANLPRLTGKWRYELLYWDFTFGVFLAVLLAALTLGTLNSKELTFQDNLLIASYHKIGYAFSTGMVLNLGNVLLIGALSVAPVSVAFPIAMGLAMVVSAGWSLSSGQGVLLPIGGAVVVLAAIVVNAFTYGTFLQELRAVKKPLTPDPRTAPPGPKPVAPPSAAKGVALSVISGIALGMASPLLNVATHGDDGLGGYSAALIIGIAVLASTIVYAPFFTVFAVHGAPVQLRAYARGSKKQHLYGLLAGALWGAGLIARSISGGSLTTIDAGLAATRFFEGGAVILAALLGFLVFREFKGGSYRVRMLMTAMLVLWAVGGVMIALAPEVGK